MSMNINIKSEIGEISRKITGRTERRPNQRPVTYYQSVIFFKEERRLLWKKQVYTLPFYSPEIFDDDNAATAFLPMFLARLIKEDKIPREVILPDKSVDEEYIRMAIAPLVVTQLELDRDD
jgi:hypothetical protein